MLHSRTPRFMFLTIVSHGFGTLGNFQYSLCHVRQ